MPQTHQLRLRHGAAVAERRGDARVAGVSLRVRGGRRLAELAEVRKAQHVGVKVLVPGGMRESAASGETLEGSPWPGRLSAGARLLHAVVVSRQPFLPLDLGGRLKKLT